MAANKSGLENLFGMSCNWLTSHFAEFSDFGFGACKKKKKFIFSQHFVHSLCANFKNELSSSVLYFEFVHSRVKNTQIDSCLRQH